MSWTASGASTPKSSPCGPERGSPAARSPFGTRSGDNLLIHKALKIARPGDVVVVNGEGDESRALMGDLIGARAKRLGVAGFVLDGAARDAEGLGELGMPVSRGPSPRPGPTSSVPVTSASPSPSGASRSRRATSSSATPTAWW
jgi:hypothetical protein